jgi:predicted dienelactone hydrolase
MSTAQLGFHGVPLYDRVQQLAIPLICFYPTLAPTQTQAFGPFSMDVATDAPPAGRGLPLVLVSHGSGGTLWAYRDMAAHLARQGFVVALVEHLGNSRSDNSLAGTMANLVNRPRHLHLAINAVLADKLLETAVALDHHGVAVIGHSMGAYTALALAGGNPWTGPEERGNKPSEPVAAVTHDARVRALVLLNPAAAWFLPEGALAGVTAPILLLTGEQDGITPAWQSDIVRRGVANPAMVEHVAAPNAGHFSFMSPFPPAMTRPDFPPSQDPPGFDRTAFQAVLHSKVEAFLRHAL